MDIEGYVNVGSSYGIGIGSGITEYKFKYKSNGDSGIGITSNLENCKGNKWMYKYEDAETYYVGMPSWGSYGCHGGNNKFRKHDDTAFEVPGVKHGDIKLQMDCTDQKDWILKYFNNDKEVGQFEIEPNLTYYICISAGYQNEAFEIVY